MAGPTRAVVANPGQCPRTGRTAQRPRVRGAARRLPGPVPCCLRGCARAAPRTPSADPAARAAAPPARARRRPRTPLSRDAARAGGRPGGRRTRRLGRPGVLRPMTYCPPGRPPCRPPPRNFADWPGPGMAQAQGPCPRGEGSGALRLQAGRRRPPARRYHSHGGTRRGTCGLRGHAAPIRAKPSTTSPAGRRGRCSRSGQRKGRRHHRPARLPPDAHLIGDLPPHLQAMTGRSGHQPPRRPGMSCPSRPRSRPGRSGWPGRHMDLHAQHPVPARI